MNAKKIKNKKNQFNDFIKKGPGKTIKCWPSITNEELIRKLFKSVEKKLGPSL